MGTLGIGPNCTYYTCWQGETALSVLGVGYAKPGPHLSSLNGSCSI